MRRDKPPRRWALEPFTDKELIVVELRTHGVKTPEIARRLGISRSAVAHRLAAVYRKAGFDDVALLTRWAITNALDEPLEPEPPAPKVTKKRGRVPIQMGRIRRARLR